MYSSLKRPSLADVARQLHLAPSTVSRALADGADVSAATKARVQAAAQALGYQPNRLAAAVRRGRSSLLGVVVPSLSGGFFPQVLHSIEQQASRAGYGILICQSGGLARREREHIDMLLAQRVEGMLLATAAVAAAELAYLEQVQQSVPLVFFDRLPALPACRAVVLDDEQGAYQAVAHLLRQGCRRVACLTGPLQLAPYANSLRGYHRALREYQLPARPEWEHPLPALTAEAGRTAMYHLLALAQPPDAVFVAASAPAAGALAAARERGWRVPHDVAVACRGDEELTSLTQPALTALSSGAGHLGKAAVALLLHALGPERPAGQFQQLVLPPGLQVRASTLCPPGSRPPVAAARARALEQAA